MKVTRVADIHGRTPMLNRTQAAVLGFLLLAWAGLAVILAAAPEICRESLKLAPGNTELAEVAFFAALSAFLVFLGVGVVRRWRWTFWLILFAFLAGVLRAPASVIQVLGIVSPSSPTWYLLLQALLGLVQFLIGVAMLVGYRRAGTWASF